jgi:RNA polymerase sigma factor (sigma-70 family)
MDELVEPKPESDAALEAANELVTKNIRLAYSFARKRSSCGLDPDEIDSIAMEGLIKASRTYDPSVAAFSTWAYRIMGQMLSKELTSRHTDKRKTLDRAHGFLMDDKGREVLPEITSENKDAFEVQEAIQKIWAKLDARERTVLRARFWDGKTFDELSAELGVSRARVQQIQIEALNKARRRILDRRDAGKSSIDLTCAGCNRVFKKRKAEVRYHQNRGSNRFYCSKKCFYRHRWAQRAWTDRDDAELLANRNLPYKKLAKIVGRSVIAVRSRLARLNATKQKWWWSESDIQFLRDNVGTMTMRELGERLGRTAGAIGIRLYAMGLTYDRKVMNTMRDAKAHELHAAGWFDKDIASEIGVHPSVVWHWRKRNGLKVNGHAGYRKKVVPLSEVA